MGETRRETPPIGITPPKTWEYIPHQDGDQIVWTYRPSSCDRYYVEGEADLDAEPYLKVVDRRDVENTQSDWIVEYEPGEKGPIHNIFVTKDAEPRAAAVADAILDRVEQEYYFDADEYEPLTTNFPLP